MDPLTLIGVGGAFLLLLVGVIMEGTNIGTLIGIPAFIIVVVPTVMISLAGLTKADLKTVFSGLKRAFLGKAASPREPITQMVSFAEQARRDGLLSLEEPAKSIEDPFLRRGIELAVDGTDPEELAEILEAEVEAKRQEHKVAAKFFSDMGGYSPTLGIIGAVTGLIHVLGNLENPAAAGHGIAGAFVATFYGVAFANMAFLPIANKLKRVAEIEISRMSIIVEGILSIQAGANPRVVEQKLLAFVPGGAAADGPGEDKAA